MKVSIERLVHFQCDHCTKWWTIADAPIETKELWNCPWCGNYNAITDISIPDTVS